MSAAQDWLARRVGDAPRALLASMTVAVEPYDASPVPDALAAAAEALYRSVVGSQGLRENALALLTADALLTHAFQAQAEMEPSDIGRFATRWSGRGRLGEVPL